MDTRSKLVQKMAYCLRKGSMIELIGKRGGPTCIRLPAPNWQLQLSGCAGS